MFWKNILTGRVCLYKSHILYNSHITNSVSRCASLCKYSAISTNIINCYGAQWNRQKEYLTHFSNSNCLLVQRILYSKGLVDGDISELLESQHEQEIQNVTTLFPQPRVTLNEYAAKTQEKVFEIHYKQNMSSPKVARKKQKPLSNSWTCTYALISPEKVKFESTGLSKRQAAEKAAIQALHYLYINNRIDSKGNPVYNKDKIEELKSVLQEPIKIKIGEKSMERVEKIWQDYENGIKDIYEATFKQAAQRMSIPPPVVTKDSSLEEDDDVTDNEGSCSDGEVDDIADLKIPIHPVYGKPITQPPEATLQRRDRVLKQAFERYKEELIPLPLDDYADKITSIIDENRVVVIVGAAGCGKSTRTPAAVLRHCGSQAAVVVSQPRRVAAIDLARTVARDLGEQVGESIGYQVRLQARPPRPPAGSVLYCTSGVLLRRLQTNPGLIGCSHVFIDEAHERDVNTDITLLLLKRAVGLNPALKVVIMSATLDTEIFTRYFDPCPVIQVPGRAYPVSVRHLDDIQKEFGLTLRDTAGLCQRGEGRVQVYCQEVVQVIKAVDKTQPEGAILVFLPGWAEIRQTKQLLDEACSASTHIILPVHSRLSTTDQVKMFAKPIPGVRKIVLATNIAETSITIPDVVYVIDTGAHKENRIKEGTGTASLETVWVSQAGAKQRAGRAGRVQPGHCYKMYTTEKEAEFAPYTTPEILRVPLEQTVLDCKSYAPDDKVENFLSQLPQPPTERAIHLAVNDLTEIGALSQDQKLTRLGWLLSSMTLHPRLGLALLHSAFVGGAIAAANVLTHCSDNVELFRNAVERREEIREFKRRYNPTSDHSALHWIQQEFEEKVAELGRGVDAWCDSHGLRKDRLGYVKSLSSLHLEQLLKSGVIEPSVATEDLNRFSDIDEITAAILLSGAGTLMRTKRLVRTKGKLRTVTDLFTSTGDRAHIGSESVNYDITKKPQANNILVYFGGQHSMERRALVIYKSSLVPPHTALLFTKGTVRKQDEVPESEETVLSLPKHRLHIHVPSSQAEHLLKAREMLWNTFQYYIDRNIRAIDFEENTRISRFKVRLVKAVGRILVDGHREYVLGKPPSDNIEDVANR